MNSPYCTLCEFVVVDLGTPFPLFTTISRDSRPSVLLEPSISINLSLGKHQLDLGDLEHSPLIG